VWDRPELEPATGHPERAWDPTLLGQLGRLSNVEQHDATRVELGGNRVGVGTLDSGASSGDELARCGNAPPVHRRSFSRTVW
jgi:hypothetical protein